MSSTARHQVKWRCLFCSRLWVLALARFAVCLRNHAAFDRARATVAAIVAAGFVVVLVVAVAVALVRRCAASLAGRVEALAHFAVGLLDNAAFHSCGATVAAIERAAFVVVLVVAIAVALVSRLAALGSRLAKVLRVDTLALFAEVLLH